LKKNKIFLFFGPPGSGKGTLSEMCVDQFGWLQLSTGNLCRQHIAQSTVIGNQIKQIISQGGLVPDEIIAQMVVDWITSQTTKPQGIVFDGYPRTKKQAEMLYNFWQEKLFEFELILVKLNIDAQLLTDRILNRVVCSNKDCGRVYSLSQTSQNRPVQDMICDVCKSALVRRSDDTQAALELRLKIYYQHEQEILDFYVDKGFKVNELDGDQGAQNLFEDFKKIVLLNYVS
jgi:adenylate kinase